MLYAALTIISGAILFTILNRDNAERLTPLRDKA